MYVIYHGQCKKAHVRERARVTIVTRLCARVEHSALFVQNRQVAMLSWKLKGNLCGDLLDFQVNLNSCAWSLLWAIQNAPRARTRAGDHGHPPVCARRAFCIFHEKVAIFAWKSKWALGGDRLDFPVNMSSRVCYLLCAMQKAPRARTRAGDHGHPPVCARGALCKFQDQQDALLLCESK